MKKTVLSIASLLLAALTLVSCGNNTPSTVDTEPVTEEPQVETTEIIETVHDIQLTSGGKCLFKVVRPDEASDEVVEYAKELREKIQNVTGIKCEIGNDFIIPTKKHDADAWEILVGKTNYDETAAVLSELKYLDYTVRLSGHKIVITSPNDARIDPALTKLMTAITKNSYQDESGDWWMKLEDVTYTAKYKVDSLKIAGTDYSEYVIVYSSNGSMKEAAENVQSTLATATGVEIPLVTDKTAEAEYEIIIGKTKRLEIETETSKYNVYISGKKLVFACLGANSSEAAVKKLYSDKLNAGGSIEIDSSYKLEGYWNEDEGTPLTEGADVRIISFNILKESYATSAGWDCPTAPRAELLANMLEKYRPDAIGIQEADGTWIKAIKTYCGDYTPCCTSRTDGVENYSNILYDSSRYNLVKSEVSSYSTSDNKCCRNIAWALLENKTTGKQFILISTHWDLTETPRVTQAQELAAKVNSLHEEYKVPVFSTGDYNARQDSTPIATYRSLNNMWCSYFDAKKYYNRYGSYGSGGFGKMSVEGGGFIDYVFATKSDTEILASMTVINCETEYISDHRPVLADIKFTQ